MQRAGITRRRVASGIAAGSALIPIHKAFGAIGMGVPAASSGGGGGGVLTTLVVSNPGSGALAANSFIQFGHGYGATDIPSGNILSIVDDLSSSVPYTAMRRSTAGGTSVRFTDNIARLPNSIAAPLTVTSITHSGTTATVTTSAPHSLSTGAQVHMEGQAPDDYCGLYTITSTGASTFTYVMPTTPATNATTAGVMNYTRVLTLSSVAGSWNNTLPNSKTSTNIITDITTNFDNLTLTLSSVTNSAGATVASGTFNADLATALAASGTAGQLRTPASGQGQLVCDIVALMKFNDNVTPATHLGSMSAWFYLTAYLDQTTGAVQELRCRVWIDNSLANVAQDYYTYQATLKLGVTTVRSTGLSTNAAIDGKVQSFAAAAVNTSTGVISLPSHGFVGGETVRFTTSGALPTGLSLNTDYAAVWIDANNFGVANAGFSEGNQVGNSTLLPPSTQGTGTHTVTCWLHSAFRNRIPYCRNDGLPDRWTGKTGAFSPQLTHCIHSKTYLQQTRLVPPVDLTLNLANKIAVAPAGNPNVPAINKFCYGGLGTMQYAQNAGGGGLAHEYGGPWTDTPLRRLRYCNDRAGYVQTLRTDTLMLGMFDVALINDDTLWRMPTVNNGPARNGVAYTGLPTPAPNSFFNSNIAVSGFTAPTSLKLQNGLTAGYSFSHRYTLYPRLYLFEGGQDIHDMLAFDAAAAIVSNSAGAGVTFPTTDQISARNYSIAGTTYYWFVSGSEPRTDAFTVQVQTDAVMLCDDACIEKPYLSDVFNDWLKIANWLVSTYCAVHDPNYTVIGGWTFGEVARHGPGNPYGGQCDAITLFYQSYIGMCWGHSRRMYGAHADFDGLLSVFYTMVDVLYRQTTGVGAFATTYGLRTKQAAGLNANAVNTVSAITAPQFEESNLATSEGCILFRSDGVIIGCTLHDFPDIFPAIGDQHYITDTDIDGTVASGSWNTPPSQLYNTYFVRQASGTYEGGWKYATTNSDATILGSYATHSASTLNGAINAVQTTITTNVALTAPPGGTFSANPFSLIVVGTEIMLVTAGFGTTSLTVQRAQYGSTAATAINGAAIYVPYTSTLFTDYQNRASAFPPTQHIYRYTVKNGMPDGYNTMMRSQAFYGYLLGKIAKTAFTNADNWFNDAANPAGEGPTGFASNNTMKDCVDATFTS